MGRVTLETKEYNERAVELYEEIKGKSNYPLSFIIQFIEEWEETVAKLRRVK